MLVKILVGILLYVLFPIWPYEVKYTAYIIVYYIMVTLVGIFILRLALYLLVAIGGGSFWLFPKLTDDDVDILKSFTPIYSFSRWESSIYSSITRVAILLIFSYYAYHIVANPGAVIGKQYLLQLFRKFEDHRRTIERHSRLGR